MITLFKLSLIFLLNLIISPIIYNLTECLVHRLYLSTGIKSLKPDHFGQIHRHEPDQGHRRSSTSETIDSAVVCVNMIASTVIVLLLQKYTKKTQASHLLLFRLRFLENEIDIGFPWKPCKPDEHDPEKFKNLRLAKTLVLVMPYF